MTPRLKEAPCSRLQRRCHKKQNASIPTTMCCVGFSICTPTDATHSGFQTSQVFINARFLPQISSPMLVLSKEKDLTCRRLKRKASGRDGFQFVSADPPPPSWDPRRCVNVCVARRGGGGCELFLRSLRWRAGERECTGCSLRSGAPY